LNNKYSLNSDEIPRSLKGDIWKQVSLPCQGILAWLWFLIGRIRWLRTRRSVSN